MSHFSAARIAAHQTCLEHSFAIACRPVDFVWSNWPIVQCLLILARASVHAKGDATVVGSRAYLVVTLVIVWGLRLTTNFVGRGGIGHEDWRYADMRVQFGRHFWWISLFSVFLGQVRES